MEGEGEGSHVWWLMEREGEGSHVWWPMEGKGKDSFSLLLTFPHKQSYLDLLFFFLCY
jgi:hypothetical protein